MQEQDEEQYIVLTFQEKIEPTFFNKSNLFFKMVNVNTNRPFVQIGNHVFTGKYQDAISGTHLLFKTNDEPKRDNPFDVPTSINLSFLAKTTKVLSLSWQKVPDEIVNVDSKELLELEFKETYDEVLKKIENNTLDIADIIRKPASVTESVDKAPPVEKPVPVKVNVVESNCESSSSEEEAQEKSPKSNTSYSRLKDEVMEKVSKPEYYSKVDNDIFNDDREFSILKEIYLKSLNYNSLLKKLEGKDISNYVDVKASIDDGIIPNKNVENLSDQEKQLLISVANFDNLSLVMKLTVLLEHLVEEKKHLATLTEDQLREVDDYGRTPKHRYRLLKSFVSDLEYSIYVHM